MPLFGESSFDDTKNTSILQINKSLESNKILKTHLLYGYPSWTEAIKSSSFIFENCSSLFEQGEQVLID